MSPPQPRTIELASSILKHTTILENFFQENGIPSPSFDPGAPPKLPLSPEVERSLETALSSLDELMALLLGPMGWLLNQIGHAFDLTSLHSMYRFKIPSKIPVGSEIPINELSKSCLSFESNDTVPVDSEDKMTRLIQHAVSNYLLLQKSPGGPVSHTKLSAMIAQVPGLYDWIGSACEDMWPSAPHLVPAMIIQQNKTPADDNSNHLVPVTTSSQIPNSTTNHESTKSSSCSAPTVPTNFESVKRSCSVKLTGHNLAERSNTHFFQTLRSQPARMARFGNAMSVMHNMMPGFDAAAALEAYDWAGLVSESSKSSSKSTGKLTVVDLGGGQNGDFAYALAARYGQILERVVVQDLDLENKTDELKSGTGVVQFMHHDFMSEQQKQPVLGADVYFLRMVLHDWSDGDCVRILRGLGPALEPGPTIIVDDGKKKKKKGRILINDLVVPGPPAGAVGGPPSSRYLERQLRRQDLAMMAVFDSKERNEEQWRAVIQSADQRFKVASVTRLAGGLSPMAVIEVVLDED